MTCPNSYALDNLTLPVIWGTAEANVCIIAASMPVLRVLFKDLVGSKSKYNNYQGPASWEGSDLRVSPANRSKFTATASASPRSDDDSDSISIIKAAGSTRIVQTTEIKLDYRNHDSYISDDGLLDQDSKK